MASIADAARLGAADSGGLQQRRRRWRWRQLATWLRLHLHLRGRLRGRLRLLYRLYRMHPLLLRVSQLVLL